MRQYIPFLIIAVVAIALVAGCTQQKEAFKESQLAEPLSTEAQDTVSSADQTFVEETNEVQIGEML